MIKTREKAKDKDDEELKYQPNINQSSELNDTDLMNQILEEQKDVSSPKKPQDPVESNFKPGIFPLTIPSDINLIKFLSTYKNVILGMNKGSKPNATINEEDLESDEASLPDDIEKEWQEIDHKYKH